MPLTNPFRRQSDRPSLRERAAGLRTSLRPAPAASKPLPAPGSEEAKAAFKAACHEDTIRSQPFVTGYPELKRTPLEWWTSDSLAKAMEAGEITPAECARLYSLATERELRMAEIHHELNLGALHALAFAESYPVQRDRGETVTPHTLPVAPSDLADACLWAIQHRAWIDETQKEADWSDDRWDAETDKTNAVFTRAINEPSTSLREIAAKASLALEDYERFTISSPGQHDDGILIVQTVLREVAALPMRAPDAEPVDWHGPPPGFMASPTSTPFSFVRIPDGLAIEMRRLYGIALDEYERRCGYDLPPDQTERLRQDLHLDALAGALGGEQKPVPTDSLTAAILNFWPEWAAGPQHDGGTAEEDAAFEDLQQRRFALIAAADALPATTASIIPKAIALAWTAYVDQWRAGFRREDYSTDSRLALDIHAAAVEPPQALAKPHAPDLVGLVNLQSATMDELRAIHDMADEVSTVAHAMVSSGRGMAGNSRGYDDRLTPAGSLMLWIAEALNGVEDAAYDEIKRRKPANPHEQEIRLQVMARSVIENGDKAETAAFARELLASVEG